MKSRWSDPDAKRYLEDDLAMRVYTSRLLGQEPALVLHGGGNTSVKSVRTNIYGNEIDTLYIKGSGWDLKTIERSGFSPVELGLCQKLAALESLSDTEMVKQLRLALLEPDAPDGSIETLVHAVIPQKYVDHTHSDAIIVLTNSNKGKQILVETFPDFLVLPYVKPGFDLAKQFYTVVKSGELDNKIGVILRGHGIFTFANTAKDSYENMLQAVTVAEDTIFRLGSVSKKTRSFAALPVDYLQLAQIRNKVSALRGAAVTVTLDQSPIALSLSQRSDAATVATRGPLTPDHVIRTKRIPAFLDADFEADLTSYSAEYMRYFDTYAKAGHTRLDAAPRWAIWKDIGLLSFGTSHKETKIVSDIANHTAKAIQDAEALGGWQPLDSEALFEIEYWELEQRKLKKIGVSLEFQGRVAVVTGAALGIGQQCVEELLRCGASVVGLDIDTEIEKMNGNSSLGIVCDITDELQLNSAIEKTVSRFGGIDMLICNAGIFVAGSNVEDLNMTDWDKTLAVNLTANQMILKKAIPFLKMGIQPSIVVVGSRNVHAPGPGASAYSVSKAGLTQLARVLAMELAGDGVRVNVVHPDAVFDTALWTDENLESSAARYGLTVDEYKTRNLLNTEIKSTDVAAVCAALCSSLFSKTTGAQIPIDGGNDRIL